MGLGDGAGSDIPATVSGDAHEVHVPVAGQRLAGDEALEDAAAVLAQKMSQKLLDRGVYAVGFFYPVVPKGKARVRTQISAAHTKEDLDKAIASFAATYAELTD